MQMYAGSGFAYIIILFSLEKVRATCGAKG